MKNYIIYVDGFNFYHRRIKETTYKWLDLKALVRSFNFKDCRISKIRYFTAKVKPSSNNLRVGQRQDLYIRALQTIPEVEIHYGQFRKRKVKGRLLAEGNLLHGQIVEISKFEEKGSDVNIATFMLADCFQKLCDVPVLLSNDSDLTEPLKYIKTVLNRPVGIIMPVPKPSSALKRYSSFRRKISDKQLETSQFPRHLIDSKGEFSCPKDWC